MGRPIHALCLMGLLLGCGDDGAGEVGGGDDPGDAGADGQVGDGDGDGDAGEPVSFARDVEPILLTRCVFCHHPDNGTMVDLTAVFDPEVGLVGRENSWTEASSTLLVDPGQVDNSFLIDKVARDDLDPKTEGFPMPWRIEPLTDDELASLRAWIEDGAADDARYRDEIALIFGDGVSLGSRGGKCAYCHYAGGTSPDLTDPFDPQTGVVSVMGSGGRALVEPGDPDASLVYLKVREAFTDASLGVPMPLQLEPLSEAQIDTLTRWVAQGAPDN